MLERKYESYIEDSQPIKKIQCCPKIKVTEVIKILPPSTSVSKSTKSIIQKQ